MEQEVKKILFVEYIIVALLFTRFYVVADLTGLQGFIILMTIIATDWLGYIVWLNSILRLTGKSREILLSLSTKTVMLGVKIIKVLVVVVVYSKIFGYVW